MTSTYRKHKTESCASCGSQERLTIHHMEPRSMGGPNTRENLQTLCHNCHVELHRYNRPPKPPRQSLVHRHLEEARRLMPMRSFEVVAGRVVDVTDQPSCSGEMGA